MARRKKRETSKAEYMKANYKKLRDAGFSPKDARRYRAASPENIEKVVKGKSLPAKDKKRAKAGASKGWKYEMKKRAKARGCQEGRILYQDVDQASYIYTRKYTYIVSFYQRSGKEYHEKIIAWNSDEPLSKKKLFKEIEEEAFKVNETRYAPAKPIMSSLCVQSAYMNPRI